MNPWPDERFFARSDAAESERRLSVMSRVVLVAAVVIPAIGLIPELSIITPEMNDRAFHLGLARNTIAAIREGGNPLDFWVPSWLGGYPLFRYYQPAPYLLLAGLHAILPHAVSLEILIRWVTVAALLLFPLANYHALCWLGLGREVACWAAFFSCLVSGGGTYGIEMESFVWIGWGLFAQAVALPLLPLALAAGWRSVRRGGTTLGAATMLAGVLLCHILYGYIAALSLAVAPLFGRTWRDVARVAGRVAMLGAQTLALVAFFVVPLALGSAYHAKSLFDGAEKFDSHGAAVVLTRLLGGTLLDRGRLPVITVLAFTGLYLCARGWFEQRRHVDGWIMSCFVLWILLYFGRATWGRLVDVLPLSDGLHMERLSNGVQIFAIWLAAIALGAAARWWAGFESPLARVVIAFGVLLLLCPIVGERAMYFQRNASVLRDEQRRFRADMRSFAPVLERLLAEPPGRVYAGHSGNWGHKYRIGDVPVYDLLSAKAVDDIGNAPFSWPLPSDFQFFFDPTDRGSQDLYDVDYVITDRSDLVPPESDLLVSSGRHRLYRLHPEGRFGIVAAPVAVVGDQQTSWYVTLAWAQSPWARRRALLRLFVDGAAQDVPIVRMDGPFHYLPARDGAASVNVFAGRSIFAGHPPTVPHGVVRDVAVARNTASANVELDAPAVVVFKTTYHPAWNARLDDVPVHPMVLTPGFIGIGVPAGAHRIDLVYAGGRWKPIALIAGMLTAIGIDLLARVRRRERPRVSSA